MSTMHDKPQNRKGIQNKQNEEVKYHHFAVSHDAPMHNHFRAKSKGYEKWEEGSTEMETLYRIQIEQYQAAAKVNEDRAKRLTPQKGTQARAGESGIAGSIVEGFENTGESVSMKEVAEAFTKSADD